MSKLDIIIPVYNSVDLTWRCVQHVLMEGVQRRIILVDDGSSDTTPKIGRFVEGRGGLYVRHDKNRGCHAAWNTGWRAADATHVMFLNNDVCVMPGCIRRMVQIGVEHDGAIVSARQLTGPWDPGLALSMADAVRGDMGVREDFFGGCFLVPRQHLLKLDGFDEQFYLTYGDTDFLERHRDLIGSAPLVVMNAVAFHGQSMTRRREFGKERDVALDLEDRARFERKWMLRPDVLERHPRLDKEIMEHARDAYWDQGEPVKGVTIGSMK